MKSLTTEQAIAEAGRKARISEQRRQSVIRLAENGYLPAEIAAEQSIHASTVQTILREARF